MDTTCVLPFGKRSLAKSHTQHSYPHPHTPPFARTIHLAFPLLLCFQLFSKNDGTMSTAARDWFAANEEKSWSDGVSVTIKPSIWSSGEEYALYIDDGGRDGNPHAWRVQMKHKTLKPITFALTQIECHQDLRSEETIVELDVVTPAQKARCVESTKHYRAVFANRSEAAGAFDLFFFRRIR